MASVTLDRVTKRFGEVTAVQDLSIEIQDREFLVMVGPSGCGKSTTLRLIAGLEELATATFISATTWSMMSRRKTGISPWCFRATLCIHI